jgi:hypothetical protein
MKTIRAKLGVWAAALLASALTSTTAFAIGIEDVVDGGNNYPWVRVELPGTICSNGSQYRFWYYNNPNSTNLVIMYEGGGACWDYDTCSGRAGILGASNPNGIPTTYITDFKAKYVSPIVNGADPGIWPFRSKTNIATYGWDVAYMPYCTGDVHVGNRVVTYYDPTGVNPPVTYRHNGYNNTIAAANHLKTKFPSINKLLITGFSAGGVASSAAYYQVRRILNPYRGYMINDSGPIFPAPNSSYSSYQLHTLIKTQWNLTSLYSQLPATFNQNDFGSINSMLATSFPNDRFAYTAYKSDYNFSRFSYERFFPGITQSGILAKWRTDTTNLINQIKAYSNYSYHVPWHRPINDSHCSTIITFIGSHSCPSVRKKYWYEYAYLLPPTQTWTCPNGWTTMEGFLTKFVTNTQQSRSIEPENYYNNEDPGMQIVAPLINDAISGG